ncbi:flagellar export protein FliJ [Amphibiibacter pelophylacis]|uniref:Flagellar export protein FliJ n=1 Tax=Amphibiibacter pelophylacis TaxID=1799477 RepID=A0ACC6P077_9BURK
MSTSPAIHNLLAHEKTQRDQALTQLHSTREALNQAQSRSDQLSQHRSAYEQHWRERHTQGESSIEVMRCYNDYMNRLDMAISQQGSLLTQAEERMAHARRLVLEAELRVARTQKLLDRRQAEILQDAQRREQKMFDEQAQTLSWHAQRQAANS